MEVTDPSATPVLNFHQRRILGRTGLTVSRLGLGASYGIGAAGVERAYGDYGVNYLYWGSMRTAPFGEGIRRIGARHRADLVLVVQTYTRFPAWVERTVNRALRSLGFDYADILVLGWFNRPPSRRLMDAALELKRKGRVRFLAVSSHHRPAFAEFARQGLIDVFMFRYNAAHRGAEREVLPLLTGGGRPGAVAYTATRWGQLIDSRRVPPGEEVPRASDCYRFVLSDGRVDVCLAGPRNDDELTEALAALDRGPMTADEREWMRRAGEYVYHHGSKWQNRLMRLDI